jgi:hypothetical protein
MWWVAAWPGNAGRTRWFRRLHQELGHLARTRGIKRDVQAEDVLDHLEEEKEEAGDSPRE